MSLYLDLAVFAVCRWFVQCPVFQWRQRADETLDWLHSNVDGDNDGNDAIVREWMREIEMDRDKEEEENPNDGFLFHIHYKSRPFNRTHTQPLQLLFEPWNKAIDLILVTNCGSSSASSSHCNHQSLTLLALQCFSILKIDESEELKRGHLFGASCAPIGRWFFHNLKLSAFISHLQFYFLLRVWLKFFLRSIAIRF